MRRAAITRLLDPLLGSARDDVQITDCTRIDVAKLTDTIFEVEQSLHLQGLELSPRDQAELIVEAYLTATRCGTPPDRQQIDRIVWMKAS
jgi:hypothetical protein